MARYQKKVWQDRAVQKPLTYTSVTNPDGSISFTPAPGVITQAGTPQNALNLNNIEEGIGEALWFATTAQPVANAYTATLDPIPTAYYAGMAVRLIVNASSTGAVTINLNGLGAKSVKTSQGAAVANWKLNAIVTLVYNGTDFISQGEGSDGNAAPADLLAGKTATTITGDITGTMVNQPNAVNAISKAIGNPGEIYVRFPLGAYLTPTPAGYPEVLITDPNFIAANIRTDKPMFGLAGTMPVHSGADYLGTGYLGAEGIIYIRPEAGFWDGVSNTYRQDPNFIAANLIKNMSMFGLVGTGVNAKNYASGTAISSAATMNFTDEVNSINTTAALNVAGLNFPSGIAAIRIGTGIAAENTWFFNTLSTPNSKIFMSSGAGFVRLTGNAFVNTNSFQMPVSGTSKSFTWEAWGL